MIFYCFNNNNFVFHDIYDFGGITCWSQKPEERPSFEEIVSILKNDQNYKEVGLRFGSSAQHHLLPEIILNTKIAKE